ncbi:hypothetical protein Bandiella_00777 [Candidatus Bandiella woodruffii]|uniref:Uncharacterized protein n=1 Tax=Candidatus Bandiella euplotis TaxID=1664265 RepID=A0ABZ0UNU6_9RICK|nr:hypothetical protein Bandiella_00777 [Candidatus Bandiella woodruffii]
MTTLSNELNENGVGSKVNDVLSNHILYEDM